ncbi:hypothetical protein PMAYCL1PPCAC_26323 [Pristionchus mayeri]|uniref:Uncharacterized protein n=1 Tax=Pristionchus mayeri TaxID=1317129 RepID=A0AAN5I861_9BILA|nr:hypothetical protein PMAYCL1PPCAC_26323 [Pristionchus mayeri]
MHSHLDNTSDHCGEKLLAIAGTRIGDCYVSQAVTNGSAVRMDSAYQHIQSQNAYMPYECGFQTESRNLGFGPDYGYHYGF